MHNLLLAASLALPLLALLGTAPPVVAGPPEGVSGRMVLHELTDKLTRLRVEKHTKRKLALVKELGPVRDARVRVALMEIILKAERADPLLIDVSLLLYQYHIPDNDRISLTAIDWTLCRQWWERHEADVRRRAAQLFR
jgi:hypothetical protein